MESAYFMWGERGLVATFFADLHLCGHLDAFNAFLNQIDIADTRFPRTATAIVSFIEPDFANTGFGHPDAVLRVETDEDEFAIILEAKRGCYMNACKPVALRGVKNSGYNSSLNGQLELDFALALALQDFNEDESELVEPEWIMETPYSVERKKVGRRRLKNQHVLQSIVKEICGFPLENYFFVSLTNDCANPYLDEKNVQSLPELFHTAYGTDNCWQHMKHQFGWINYSTLESLVRGLVDKKCLGSDSLFLKSMELNRRNMPGVSVRGSSNRSRSSGSRGVSLIYAPTIQPGSFLHFSWWGESCALRDYSSHPSLRPIPQRQYTTSQIRPLVEREMRVAREGSVEKVAYWHKRISDLNAKLLSG